MKKDIKAVFLALVGLLFSLITLFIATYVFLIGGTLAWILFIVDILFIGIIVLEEDKRGLI